MYMLSVKSQQFCSTDQFYFNSEGFGYGNKMKKEGKIQNVFIVFVFEA